MTATVQRVTFEGSQGDTLAARFDVPAGTVRATAIFAHCFTCSKDILAAKRIAGELAMRGIAVLRFDFTGLGASDGEFANTNFSSNCADLIRAAGWLRDNVEAPSILIGHSLGGAAVLGVAGDIAEVRAVATIGAPADAEHVAHNFHADLEAIKRDGEAEVSLAGRKFRIQKQFLDDIRGQNLTDRIAGMKKALMVLHSPLDDTVGIDNAATIFQAARHPKSFVSLDKADHLLSGADDAAYAAEIIAAWASRFIAREAALASDEHAAIRVAETGGGKFQNYVIAGRHRMFADEPEDVGGLDSGPSPYDFLAVALAACTSMTLRIYAAFKKLDIGTIAVDVAHDKVHAKDCQDCAEELRDRPGKIDRFERRITVAGEIDVALEAKLLEIADKCPIHRTLEKGAAVVTRVAGE
jgi:putative redox protein